jgi:hypothetical protein
MLYTCTFISIHMYNLLFIIYNSLYFIYIHIHIHIHIRIRHMYSYSNISHKMWKSTDVEKITQRTYLVTITTPCDFTCNLHAVFDYDDVDNDSSSSAKIIYPLRISRDVSPSSFDVTSRLNIRHLRISVSPALFPIGSKNREGDFIFLNICL